MEQIKENIPKELKRLKTAFFISVVGTSILVSIVILAMIQEKNDILFLGGGSVFILYYFITTYSPIIKEYSTISSKKPTKKLSFEKSIAGYISLVNGWVMILAGIALPVFMGIEMYNEDKLTFDSSAIGLTLYCMSILIYGVSITYYVTKSLNILKK